MHYEVVSRALAYVSCLSTMSLLATTMAMAAVNVGLLQSPSACSQKACAVALAKPETMTFGGLTNKVHVEAVAAVLWSTKI
jgi:hypothetical protein